MSPDELRGNDPEVQWTTEGPNSGGVGGWWLFRGHMFSFHTDSGSTVSDGIPVSEWLGRYGDRHPEIREALRERGHGEPT